MNIDAVCWWCTAAFAAIADTADTEIITALSVDNCFEKKIVIEEINIEDIGNS